MSQEIKTTSAGSNGHLLGIDVDTSMHDADQSVESRETKRVAPHLVPGMIVHSKVEVRHMFDMHLARRRRSKAVGEEEGAEEQVRRKRRQMFGVDGRE